MKNKLLGKITSTLRGKLALWYLMSVGLIISLFLIAISVLFGITLQNQIDHHLEIAVNEVSQIVQQFRGEKRNELIKNIASTQGMTVVILSPDGSPVLETNAPGVAPVTEHQLQKILSLSSLYQSSPVHFTENNIRFSAKPIQISAGKGIASVGYSIQILYATFIKMLGVVGGILLLLVLPITIIGYKLLKKQLQPLERIALQAEKIGSIPTLFKRIHISSPTQELKTIQKALNSMLSKLENIFKKERRFFLDAAHTLKTPLAVLRSQIENSNIPKKVRNRLLETIDTTNNTIENLLLLSKIDSQSQKITVFSVSNLMFNLSELATTLGEEKNLKVTSDIQENIDIKGDKNLFQRALSNIVYNAVIYNKINGTIQLSLKRTSSHFTIVIKDTGIGIKKDEQLQAFIRFFRGSNVQNRGSGLGLAISKTVIENFGGKILLNSSLNKGTKITIIF